MQKLTKNEIYLICTELNRLSEAFKWCVVNGENSSEMFLYNSKRYSDISQRLLQALLENDTQIEIEQGEMEQ